MVRALGALAVLLLALAFLPPLAADLFGYRTSPKLVPRDGRLVDIGEGRFLHVVEKGQGPPVVLVHGLPGTAADWAQTPRHLAEQGFRVISYDRVGYGHSSREPETTTGYTYRSNADDLRALLDALKIESAMLAGWSYGGAVVQTFAQTWPERASSLALIGSVGPSMVGEEYESAGVMGLLEGGAGEAIFEWLAAIPPLGRAVTRDILTEAFGKERAIPDGWVDRTRAALELPGSFRAMIEEEARGDPGALRPELLTMPTLVIHGTEDRLVPYDVAEHLAARLPLARLETVFDGSHMLPVTHPEQLARDMYELATGGFILGSAE